VRLFRQDAQRESQTLWVCRPGCMQQTSPSLSLGEWNTSKELLAPGPWRAEIYDGEVLADELSFEITEAESTTIHFEIDAHPE
jgi:hypothetical protein